MNLMKVCKIKVMPSLSSKHLGMILIVAIIPGMVTPALAQRSRRTATVKKQTVSPTTMPGTTTANIEQLEARNRELLKQILDLQYERDFYRKKLSEWTEAQRLALEEEKKKATETPPAQPAQPLVIPYPLTGWQAPVQPAQEPVRPLLTPADSLLKLARAASRQGQYLTAHDLFKQMVSQPGCSDQHYLAYGRFLYHLADYTAALPILNQVTANDSLSALAAYYKARIYQEQGATQLANLEMIRSKVLAPAFHGYLVALAYQLLSQGSSDSAEQLFNHLLQKPTGLEAEIYTGLAELAYRRQDRPREINYLQLSLGYESGDMRNIFDLGVALLEQGDYQSALALLQSIGKYPQPHINLHFYLGQAYYHKQQWSQALAEFQQISIERWGREERDFWLAKTYYLLSLKAKAQGDFRDATDYFRKAREAHPEATNWMQAALNDLAQIFENERQYNRALEAYVQGLRLIPQDGATLLRLGELYYKIGDIQEARRTFERVLRYPTFAAQAENWLQQIDTLIP